MKQTILLLGSGLLVAATAHAQLGVRAGGNTAIFTKGERMSDSNPTARQQLGYQVGVFYQVPLSKRLFLVPELQFSRENFYVSYTPSLPPGIIYYEGPPRNDYDQSLSYLNLPVLLRATVGPLYLEAGPQLGLLLGGRAENTPYTNNIAGYYTRIDESAVRSYHHIDVGPCVGVGVKLPAGLGIGVRAYWGLSKLTSDGQYSAFSPTYTGFQHRQTLQASLTYQLPTH